MEAQVGDETLTLGHSNSSNGSGPYPFLFPVAVAICHDRVEILMAVVAHMPGGMVFFRVFPILVRLVTFAAGNIVSR